MRALSRVPALLPRKVGGRIHSSHLQFEADAGLPDPCTFAQWLTPLRKVEWVVYAKCPLAGPAAVLSCLPRYTHHVALAKSNLLAFDDRGVTVGRKDHCATGNTRYKTMTLATDEFMYRHLLHVLPSGFHHIRHYSVLANAGRSEHLTQVRGPISIAP